MPRTVTLLGAGLTGPLLAILLARRGYRVDLYERRADMRLGAVERGRSINLALSTRGIAALEIAGVAGQVLADAIRMPGRMIHGLDGTLDFQPYGRVGQAINSVSRSGLNITLIDAAEREPNVRVRFDTRCTDVDLNRRIVTLHDQSTDETFQIEPDLLISAEGAGSTLRTAMERDLQGFEAHTEWLDHAYKELEIPPVPDGGFRMEREALHIWPRHDFMMIALPNPDATFTCTLFAPLEGEGGLDAVRTEEEVVAYMTRNFPDAVPVMPTLVEDWFANPTARLGTVFCEPWYVDDWALLVGDAAHAIVPFYGQGMNCCFEDCAVLDGLLDRYGDDWSVIAREFFALRKPNADAIARLAVANFLEMRSKVVDPVFLRKRTLDARLHDLLGDRWMPLYSMVTFSTIPYAEALRRAAAQDALVAGVGIERVEEAVARGTEAAAALLFDGQTV